MAVLATLQPVTEKEYLTNPEYEHCEYIDGQVVPLNVGDKSHARIQVRCATKLSLYCDAQPGGYVATELHCRITIAGKPRYRLPDIAVVLGDESTEGRYLQRSPDLVVEIRSADDSLHSLFRKMEDYFANGARLGWLILPEERCILIFTGGASPRTAMAGDQLDGGSLLPGLEIPVDYLFS